MRQAIMGSRAGADFPAGDFLTALRQGFRAFWLDEPDQPVYEPINLDQFGGGFLRFAGPGRFSANIQKNFSGAPIFKSVSQAWALHLHGVSLIAREDCTDGQPLMEIHYVDGGSFRECSASWSGGIGFYFPGILSETVFDTIEVSKNRFEGLRMEKARNITFQGMNRAERNGRADFSQYAGIYWKGDPFDRGHSTISGQFNLEHDERDHWGMVLDGVQGVSIPGRLRLVQSGFKTLPNCDHIEVGPITRYKEPGTGNLPRVDLKGTNLIYDVKRWVTAS